MMTKLRQFVRAWCRSERRHRLALFAVMLLYAPPTSAVEPQRLTTDGRVYAWGRNGAGQLGIGGRGKMEVPTAVRRPRASQARTRNPRPSAFRRQANLSIRW